MSFWAFIWTPRYVPAWWWYGAILLNVAACFFNPGGTFISVTAILGMLNQRFGIVWPLGYAFWL